MTLHRLIPWLVLTGCANTPGTAAETTGTGPGAACRTSTDCPPEQWCLHQRCSDRGGQSTPTDPRPPPSLSASPAALNFGAVPPQSSRSLAMVLTNHGSVMVTLEATRIAPAGAPFRVEPKGYGPFWIRPGRSREVFVTFTPTGAGHQDATVIVESDAPPVAVPLIGN